MKKLLSFIAVIGLCNFANAQTNTTVTTNNPNTNIVTGLPTPTSLLDTLQQYLVNNDPLYNGWESNHICLWSAAVFANVNGTPGASSIGNDIGLEIPIHKYNIHVESVTRFEQLFGDVHSEAVGVGYDYSVHQIQLSAGLDVEDTFVDTAIRAVPFVEFKKASTTLYGMSPMFRYEFPIQKNPGGGRILVGMQIPL